MEISKSIKADNFQNFHTSLLTTLCSRNFHTVKCVIFCRNSVKLTLNSKLFSRNIAFFQFQVQCHSVAQCGNCAKSLSPTDFSVKLFFRKKTKKLYSKCSFSHMIKSLCMNFTKHKLLIKV